MPVEVLDFGSSALYDYKRGDRLDDFIPYHGFSLNMTRSPKEQHASAMQIQQINNAAEQAKAAQARLQALGVPMFNNYQTPSVWQRTKKLLCCLPPYQAATPYRVT
jgi:hypothetical protein